MRAVVYGAGGLGREAAAWYRAAKPDARLLGFVDDAPELQGQERGGDKVLGGFEWLTANPVDEVVVAVGAPRPRKAVVGRLDGAELTLATVIHPTASIGPRVEIRPGCVLGPHVTITVDAVLGRCVVVNPQAAIAHDCRLGDYVEVGPGVRLGGATVVGEGADLGIGASTIQGVEIGAWTVLGAGAVVTNDLPAEVTAVGVPARVTA